jgi:large subunit ribosomal protein L27e
LDYSLKPGKVVIVTRGRHAGSKAVIVKNYEPKDSQINAPTSLIVGLQKYPKKVSRKVKIHYRWVDCIKRRLTSVFEDEPKTTFSTLPIETIHQSNQPPPLYANQVRF